MESLRLVDVLFATIGGLLSVGWIVLYGVIRQQRSDITKTAELVLSEKDKAAALVKIEHDRLQAEITNFRIKVAEDYATLKMVKDVLTPMIDKLNEIEKLLHLKLDRREFEQHRESVKQFRG